MNDHTAKMNGHACAVRTLRRFTEWRSYSCHECPLRSVIAMAALGPQLPAV